VSRHAPDGHRQRTMSKSVDAAGTHARSRTKAVVSASSATTCAYRPQRLPSLRPTTRSFSRRKQQHEDAATARRPECRVAWKGVATARPLLSTDAEARWGPTVRQLTPGPRPRRARRLRRTRARSCTDASVVFVMHTGVAMSLTAPLPTLTPTRPPAGPASLSSGAEHVPRIRRGEPCGARSHAGSRCRARPGKGILGRAHEGHLLLGR
jgi:hypothetical protein